MTSMCHVLLLPDRIYCRQRKFCQEDEFLPTPDSLQSRCPGIWCETLHAHAVHRRVQPGDSGAAYAAATNYRHICRWIEVPVAVPRLNPARPLARHSHVAWQSLPCAQRVVVVFTSPAPGRRGQRSRDQY